MNVQYPAVVTIHYPISTRPKKIGSVIFPSSRQETSSSEDLNKLLLLEVALLFVIGDLIQTMSR